jgi:hypothetical protein
MPIQTLHLRSNVQGKEPVAGTAAGQLPVGSIGINFNKDEPFLTIQDSAGVIRRIAGIKVGAAAPASPTAGEAWLDISVATKPVFKVHDGTAWQGAGSGVSTGATTPAAPAAGDLWVDTTTATAPVLKVYNGTAFVAVTPDASETVKGVVELATAAEAVAGTDPVRAVTPAGLKAALAAQAGSGTAPATPTSGTVWVDSSVSPSVIKVYDGTNWIVQTGATATGATAPATPAAGQIWIDTSASPSVTKIWDGTVWIAASPDGSAAAAIANDAKYATKAELQAEDLWDRTGTTLSPKTSGDLVAPAALPGATATVKGAVQLADAAAVTAGTAGLVVDAAQLKAVSDADDWTRTGTEITPKTAGDSVFTSGAVKVGGTTAAPNLQIKGDGGIVANTNGLVYDAATKRLGLGTSVPQFELTVSKQGTGVTSIIGIRAGEGGSASTSNAAILYYRIRGGGPGDVDANVAYSYNGGYLLQNTAQDGHTWLVSSGEAVRIDSSRRLLVGTSTAQGTNALQIESSGGGIFLRRNLANGSLGDGNGLGTIDFGNQSGGIGARIEAVADAGWGAGGNDYPSRLVFSSTPSGSATPVERMRIASTGTVLIGATSEPIPGSSTDVGIGLGESAGYAVFSRSGANALNICRQTNDGQLIAFHQGGTEEGNISVSGTTVSYNGAHLSRWSQLPGGVERTEILRGSVLSNIDELCGWGEEENEQLNRMKVSDVEGDKNVAGVFQAWDDDDDTYTDDFYCAMTGDFIIRIAEGITVQRGDLLMSAGDGTAKPQDDDIIRSKTIAKVTSTHVTCTYDDGSYCVPCVLMAC